ncbi:MAG: hypothetical protein KAT46_04710 [Deltaproteobacteria bacterium]|nr:hypothetical protein [Deltaproteobacteria bacterium]
MRSMILKGFLILLTFSMTYGCAPKIDYNAMEAYMGTNNNCAGVPEYLTGIEKQYGKNARLLFHMDSAMIYMHCGNFEKSNTSLHKAEEIAEDLWTKSISKGAASFITNEYSVPYSGEDFENALINLNSAVNYLMLDNTEEAMVEVRRLDALLGVYNDKYKDKNIYKEDALGRYISGIAYEATGKASDAFIDYLNAVKAYENYAASYSTRVPSVLIEDLARSALKSGRLDEARPYLSYGKADVLERARNYDKNSARVVLLHYNGKAPVKVQDKVLVGNMAKPITLVFPRYLTSSPSCTDSRLTLRNSNGDYVAGAELVEDINAISVKNLGDRKVRRTAKMIARAAVKGAIANSMERSSNDNVALAGAIFRIASSALEQADLRAWRTLPAEIYLSSLIIPKGDYDVFYETCGSEKPMGKISLGAGDTKFLLHRSPY